MKPCCDQSGLMERSPKFRCLLLQYKNARCWLHRNPKPRSPARAQITKVCDSLEETEEVSSLSNTFVPSRPIAWRYLTWRPLGWGLTLWHLGTSFRSAFKEIEDTNFLHPELGVLGRVNIVASGFLVQFRSDEIQKLRCGLFLRVLTVGFEPTPFRTRTLIWRLRPTRPCQRCWCPARQIII